MKTIMLLTGSGTLVILTSYSSPTEPGLLAKLEAKGIDKFVAYEIPLHLAEARYGQHFTVVAHDLHESDDLRVLDFSGDRAFRLFSFSELGPAITYQSPAIAQHGHVRGAEDTQ